MTFFFFIAKQLFLVLLATIVCSGAEKLLWTLLHYVAFLTGKVFVPGVFVCARTISILDSFNNHFWTRLGASEKLCRHFSDNNDGINPEY